MCMSWYNNTKISENDASRKFCLIGTAHGVLKLVDLEKNKVIFRETFSEFETLYSCDWSQQGFIVVGGQAQKLGVRRFDKGSNSLAQIKDILLTDSCRTIKFNPHMPWQVACGMFKGTILLLNVETCKIEHQIQNGVERVLCMSWHPLIADTLAVGDFGYNVNVHNIKKDSCVKLSQHKDRVRSVAWNHELPWMLISAGDDQKIVVWDIR